MLTLWEEHNNNNTNNIETGVKYNQLNHQAV